MRSDTAFWQEMAHQAANNAIIIDSPKASPHPRYPEVIYPLDYGYPEGTMSALGNGKDEWLGS
jgi:inorganic pyrophosphatase